MVFAKSIQLTAFEYQQVYRIKELIDKKPGGEHGIQQLCRIAGLSRNKLLAGFQLLYGMPLHQYVTLQRMCTAKFLLVSSDLTIKAIAAESGYSNRANFATAFKQATGYSPQVFKTVFLLPSSREKTKSNKENL